MSQTPGSALFLDATGQGFTRNLAALRDELLELRPALPMEYFFADLDSRDEVSGSERRAMRRLLKQASSDAGWVISATDSRHVRRRGPKDQRRILLVTPRLSLVDRAASGRPMSGYTDVVVAGGAFVSKAHALYPGARVHSMGLPVFAELVSTEVRDRARAQLETTCPQSAGKRIVLITTRRKPQQVFGITSVQELVKQLPEDVFLILDIPGVLDTLESEPADLGDRLFVNEGALGIFTLLALADNLLTSQFRDAVCFAVTGRKLLLLNSRELTGTLGDKLPGEYSCLGITDVTELPAALAAPYDESVRTRFQSVYAVTDPARTATELTNVLF